MITRSLMFDAIIYSYGLSLLCYFSDFRAKNKSAENMGIGLLVFVWVLQSAYFGYNLFEHRTDAIFTNLETLLLLSWFMVTCSLVINRFFHLEPLVFFMNVIGFLILVIHFFSSAHFTSANEAGAAFDGLLFAHITLAICSYAAFTIAAILSVMYLFLHRKLKKKIWSTTIQRMPSLEKIEKYTFLALLSGYPLLVFSLAFAVASIIARHQANLLWDPKVINSSIVLLVYASYFVQRKISRLNGNQLAWWNLGAFAFVLANFFIVNTFSTFHDWMRM